MNYLLWWLQRNLLKLFVFTSPLNFLLTMVASGAELIKITKNTLLNKLPDMSVHREVNVSHKRISVVRKAPIFAYFSAKLCQTHYKINKFNLPCIGWCKFLYKIFFRLEGKSVSDFRKMRKKKRK